MKPAHSETRCFVGSPPHATHVGEFRICVAEAQKPRHRCRSVALLCALGMSFLHSNAAAQQCGDDAGVLECSDAGPDAGGSTASDAGVNESVDTDGEGTPDASLRPIVLIPEPSGGSSAGNGGAPTATPGEASPACSCTHDANDDGRGRVHVCTGSFDQEACASLVCEKDTVRGVPCENEDVLYCCQMPSRALYAHLYADCANNNCEPGFFAQCEDFGGTIIDGPCETPESTIPFSPEPSEGGGSRFCGVAGARPSSAPTFGIVLALIAGLALTRRARTLRPSR
jgi:hypothetical protein